MDITSNLIIVIVLLAIMSLAIFNTTIEGISDYSAAGDYTKIGSGNYSTGDLDVIYHEDPAKDYNKLLADVNSDPTVITAFANAPELAEIQTVITADPTILTDLNSRLKLYIDKYASDPVESAKIQTLIATLTKSVNNSNFITDPDAVNKSTVKDFNVLLTDVMTNPVIKKTFTTNSPLLDGIALKINSNPQILESARARLKPDTDAINQPSITDPLMSQIEAIVSATIYIKQIDSSDKLGGIIYNQPGYFRFGPSNYVPNYEDSVYLSRLTGLSYAAPVVGTDSQFGGFCAFNQSNPGQTELECNKLDSNTCASTSCCVLLGGSKCVSGNEKGPTMKANFGDVYINNKDRYYYQGNCYGNCPDN